MASAKTAAPDLTGLSFEQLQALMKQAQSVIATQLQARRFDDLQTVLELVNTHNFTAQELGLHSYAAPIRKQQQRKTPGALMKADAMGTVYRHPLHGDWQSGKRGKPPGWVSAAKANGSLERLRIGQDPTPSAPTPIDTPAPATVN